DVFQPISQVIDHGTSVRLAVVDKDHGAQRSSRTHDNSWQRPQSGYHGIRQDERLVSFLPVADTCSQFPYSPATLADCSRFSSHDASSCVSAISLSTRFFSSSSRAATSPGTPR